MEVFLTLHGTVDAIRSATDNISRELQVINSFSEDESDIDLLSTIFIHRDLITLKLNYCKGKLEGIINSFGKISNESISGAKESCLIAIQKIINIDKENQHRKDQIGIKLKNVKKH